MKTVRFTKGTRFYELVIVANLFGSFDLVAVNGAIGQTLGRFRTTLSGDLNAVEAELARSAARRSARGYVMV